MLAKFRKPSEKAAPTHHAKTDALARERQHDFCGRAPLEARDFVLYLEHLSEACPAGVLRRAPEPRLLRDHRCDAGYGVEDDAGQKRVMIQHGRDSSGLVKVDRDAGSHDLQR